jgi:hypothetical protein
MSRYANRNKHIESIKNGLGLAKIARPKPPKDKYAKRRELAKAIREGTLGPPIELVLTPAMKVTAIIFGIGIVWLYAEVMRGLLGRYLGDWAKLADTLHQDSTAVWVTLAVGLSGYGFYELRRRRRLYYALIEFSLALVVTTEACLRTKDPATLAAAIISSIYFVVRAFDNFEKGLEEDIHPRSGT